MRRNRQPCEDVGHCGVHPCTGGGCPPALAARRLIRPDLAEITHTHYGILGAGQWRAILGPILNAQVNKLDLKGQCKSVPPEGSFYCWIGHVSS